MAAVIGRVRIHAQTMRSTTDQRMALRRLAAPTPMIDADTLCVVDTGMPATDAARITAAELNSAAKPLIGWSLTILWPSVLMIRQPPPAVPAALGSAQPPFTHTGTGTPPLGSCGMRSHDSHSGRWTNWPAAVAEASARAMMPMLFCASFMRWARPIAEAETICALPKKLLTKGVRPKRRAKPRREANQPRSA